MDLRAFVNDVGLGISNEDVTSAGAMEVFKQLEAAVGEITEMARICRTYICEIFLLKAVKQHQDAVEDGNDAEKASALRVVQKEMGFIAGNPLDVTQDLLEPHLLALVQNVLK